VAGEAGPLPEIRTQASAVYDPVHRRLILFGGLVHLTTLNDVWALSLGRSPHWTPLDPEGPRPPARWGGTAVYDPRGNRFLLFGGESDGRRFDDVWALSLGPMPAWMRLEPRGEGPAARVGHTAVYDPARDRILVFGGFDSEEGVGFQNDVWALSLAHTPTWERLEPAGEPPSGRDAHAAVYDPRRDRMLVIGGFDGESVVGDVWALSLAGTPRWHRLVRSGPGALFRFQHAAVYDPVRDRLLVLCGTNAIAGPGLDDVWALPLAGPARWSRLDPNGLRPGPRWGHSAVFQAGADRVVVFGGVDLAAWKNDAWALELRGQPEWVRLTPGESPESRSPRIYEPGVLR
jgi:hypothetical protein